MNPTLLRLLMVLAAVACFAAAHFLPDQATLLVTAGAGLMGWAAPAPGHAGSNGPGAGSAIATGLMAGACSALLFTSACSQLKKVNSATAARQAIQGAAKLCDAYKRDVLAGDVPREPYLDDACSLLLSPVVEPAGTGGA